MPHIVLDDNPVDKDETGVAISLDSTGWLVKENEISRAGVASGSNGLLLTNSDADINGNLLAMADGDGILASSDNVMTTDNNTLRGATIPPGIEFRFMLYINNLGPPAVDVSIRDSLDPRFACQAGTIRVDNSVAACVAQDCTPAEESAIYSAAIAAPLLSDAMDGDTASFSPSVIDIGNQSVANAQLDIAAGRVLAVVFSAKVQ